MKLSANFSLWEFERSQTATRHGIDNRAPKDVVKRLKILCANFLQPLRDHVGVVISPSSGYRSPQVNRMVGGSTTSQHMTGEAVDYRITGQTPGETIRTILKLGLEFDQLIWEFGGWVHTSYRKGANRNQVLKFENKNGALVRTNITNNVREINKLK